MSADRGVAEALERLHTLSSFDAAAAGEHLCEALQCLSHAEAICYHRPVDTRAGRRVTGLAYRATDALAEAIEGFGEGYRQVARSMKSVSASYDLGRLKPIETTAFVELHRVVPDEELAQTFFQQQILAPAGIIDQQRLLVVHDGQLLGWVGFLRKRGTPRFSPRDRRRLAPLVAAVCDVATAIARLGDDISPGEPGDLVVTPTGRIEFASDSARSWLRIPGFADALRSHVRQLDRRKAHVDVDALLPHADARAVRVDGADGVRYLVNLKKCRWRRRRLVDRLPPSLRPVAIHAAAGRTDKEIAVALDLPLSTARTYVTRVMKRLGVDHRAKLAALLARELDGLDGEGLPESSNR